MLAPHLSFELSPAGARRPPPRPGRNGEPMEFGSAASQNPTARRHTCPVCSAETWSTDADDAPCRHCGRPLPIDKPLPLESLASAVLSPPQSPMDETLTSYLAAPLPEEVLRKSANPANLFGKYVF